MTTMADLTHGTRIRHIRWDLTGTIRVVVFSQPGEWDVTEIRWDDVFGEMEISNEGPVFPVDVEIITGGDGP